MKFNRHLGMLRSLWELIGRVVDICYREKCLDRTALSH